MSQHYIMIKNVDEETHRRFARSASARGMRQADYLKALLALHESCMIEAEDNGDAQDMLEGLGLEAVGV